MIRTQIQLTDQLASQVREVAARQHVSIAEIIRMALARFLDSTGVGCDGDRYARALAACGAIETGLPRLSTLHDAEYAEALRT